MIEPGSFQGFIQLITAEMGTIPRRGLVYLGLAATFSGATDLFIWTHRPEYSALDWAILGLAFFALMGVVCLVSTIMVGVRVSLTGVLKFVITSLALVSPMFLAGVLLLVSLKSGNGLGAVTGFISMGAAFIFLTLLPGWPVLQVSSSGVVGPLTALRSTKGFRWGLFGVAFIAASMNKLVPGTSTAEDFGTACALAAGGAIVSFLSALVALSIAVAASKLMKSAIGKNSLA